MNTLKNKIEKIPKTPGVYLMKNLKGQIIYVGKATSLRDRVKSYFDRPHDIRIEKLVAEITDIDYKKTPTVIEALVLEANLIKECSPKYNVKEKDDKSFLYVAIGKEKFPKIFLIRGLETKRITPAAKKQIAKLFGPYTSAASLRAALDILRKIFPYRDCQNFPKRPCLQYHLKRCGAPCVGLISGPDYRKNIKNLVLFFEGKKERIIKNLKKEMSAASRKEDFELAARLRNKIFSLEHIQDVAVLTADSLFPERSGAKSKGWPSTGSGRNFINVFGRIEGYDISNISGTSATGSMVVFTDGKPKKSDYRKFRIKTVRGANDVGMMKEVLTRRLAHFIGHPEERSDERSRTNVRNSHTREILRSAQNDGKDTWPLPDLILVDGGWGQINAVREILTNKKIKIPVLGIAKGFDRRQDRLLYGEKNPELGRLAEQYKDILLRVRDEAHRFAIGYHKVLRKKKLLNK